MPKLVARALGASIGAVAGIPGAVVGSIAGGKGADAAASALAPAAPVFTPPPAAPTETADGSSAADQDVAEQQRRARAPRGQAATLLTGGTGDTSRANSSRRVLLGS